MTGWPRQEALGRPLSDVFRIIDATTRTRAEEHDLLSGEGFGCASLLDRLEQRS